MGFNLLKANLFRGSLFKQAKYLVSAPPTSQKVMYISEAGTISIEPLPISTGFVNSSEELKKTWALIHQLKFYVQKDDGPLEDEQVLIVSDRSYIPLDPLNLLTLKALQKLASLEDIAKLRHAAKRAEVGAAETQKDIAEFVITWDFILCILAGIAYLVMGKGKN